MIILGIDPGTRITGYGVIQLASQQIEALDYGAIRPPPKATSSKRYLIIFEGIESLIHKHRPDALSVESQFMHRNAMSAMKLGMAKAMALLAAERAGIPIFEYAPRKAKQAVVGNGAASKEQVQRMMQTLLQLPSLPTPEDAADALALALCHANTVSLSACLSTSKGP
ncbi:MAG: Crossover junction endodeoxyribonuclease RuvC [Chlamydiae bacterium]|nr:Crossover junction endodeoxyribonuclease RuvC [Chlamydiota bacterium]